MSEYVMHATVFLDARRLMLRQEEAAPGTLPDAFVRSVSQHPAYGVGGSITRGNHIHSIPLLERYRSAWSAGDEAMTQRLAWVVGWLSHRAADRFVKPMHRVLEPEHDSPTPVEHQITTARVWNDIVLYEDIYTERGNTELPQRLFSRNLRDYEAGEALDVASLEDVAHGQWLHGMAALQTQVTDADASFEERVDAFLDVRQDYYVSLERYADRMESPDPQEVQRFVHATHFYDPDDPLIELAHLPEGEPSSLSFDAARSHALTPEASQYAVILDDALRYVEAAAAFWRREIDEATLRERLSYTTWTDGPQNTGRVRSLINRYAER